MERMKLQNTPTPWESSELIAYTIQGPSGEYICQVIGRDLVERLANERLIVRAVNYYQTLLNIAENLHFKMHQTRDVTCEVCEAIFNAKGDN